MTDKTPRYHHGDLRGALIAAGRAILEEAGVQALSLREAARRANVSHAAPRHHFPSVRHFLSDCAADGFDEFTESLHAAAATETVPSEAVIAMAAAYVQFAADHRAMFLLMFDCDSLEEDTPALAASGSRAHAALVTAVRAVDPAVAGDDLEYRVASVWSLVHGYAHLMLKAKTHQRPGGAATAKRMAMRAMRDYLRGARAAEG
ncbi:TetR/AcrR family transcriptional regulator [Elstera sp.]|jgi:AcrR family transcriptional regulator|uniref:TetR/AcrR family transcriptional regulator n=1 Tax=Elstera sp. TaxID=1916664 RepID=UPI0037BF134D